MRDVVPYHFLFVYNRLCLRLQNRQSGETFKKIRCLFWNHHQ